MIIVDPANNTVDKEEGRTTLTLLVRRSQTYRANRALYADFSDLLDAVGAAAAAAIVADDPLPASAKAMNAVLAQVAALPPVLADSEGSDQERIYFSVGGNWEELARTVLDILYDPVGDATGAAFLSADRGVPESCTEVIWLDERRWL